ncbi:MAG: flagellar hook-associated protein FlgK [Peptococcaceae bacterium]
MRTTFFGLNIGAKGLAAQQQALETTGHNIANANTEGFSRQEVVMTSSYPLKTVNGFIGTGVEINDVRRMRDNYLDLQFRTENRSLGYWEFKSNVLEKVEVVINEPSESGLSSTMDLFWSAWEDLSRKPESSAVRTTVIETGQAVVETFNHMNRQLEELRVDIDESVNVNIRELNSLATQIRDLNYQIVKGEAEGPKANDLRDKRDLLLDEMSQLVDLEVVENQFGSISVSIGGRAIVSGNKTYTIEGRSNAEGFTDVVWSDGTQVKLRNGELRGMLDSRDEVVVQFIDKLDKMACSFAEKINQQHSQGFHIVEDSLMPTLQNYQGYSHGQRLDFTGPVVIDGSNNTLNFSVDGGPAASITLTNGSYNNNDELVQEINTQLAAGNHNVTAYNVDGAIRLISNTVADETKLEVSSVAINYGAAGSLEEAAANILGFFADDGVEPQPEFQGKAASFFMVTDETSGFSAGNIAINFDVLETVNLIAAATSAPYGGIEDIVGDGGNSLNIAQLKYDNTMIEGTTLDDYYRSETAKLGVTAREADRMVENQGLVVSQLESKRQMVMGVSLDEEMTNMIRFQHAYNSAARYVTAVDEMLDTLINRLGLVGR